MSAATFAALQSPQGAIEIVTTGVTFSAEIVLDAGARARWTFADGSTSESETPAIDYGSAGERVARLSVHPWTGLLGLNVGYVQEDGADVADAQFGTHPLLPNMLGLLEPQDVSAIRGLSHARRSLQYLALDQTAITELDLRGFSALQRVEAFQAGVTSAQLGGCTLLRRLCLEQCAVGSIDVSDSPLRDLRGALQASANGLESITWGDTSELWHLCVRDNPHLAAGAVPAIAALPAIEDLLLASTGRAGVCDLTDGFPAGRGGDLWLHHNQLTSIVLAGCPGIVGLVALDNLLNQAAVDAVLVALDGFGTSNGSVSLIANAVPSATGLAARDSLVARGWTVEVDT